MTRTRAFLVLQAVVCVLLVILLSASAIGIWQEGAARRVEDPLAEIYSPEIVAARLAPIAPLAFIGVGLLIAGLALGVRGESAARPVESPARARDLVVDRVARPSTDMRREQAAQRRLRLAGPGAFIASMLPASVYLMNAAHFPADDLEGMFTALLRVLLPWTAVGIGALALTSALGEGHALRELDAAKAQLERERQAGIRPDVRGPARPRNRSAIQLAVVIAAIALIVLGIFNQSARDVLYKAIAICTECVGLG